MFARFGMIFNSFIVLWLLSARVHGQIKCKIEHYSTEDGLAHNGVMSMLKDHEGFMWFGTWDGINRYDGHNFVTYKSRPGDSSRLNSTRIDNIVEDKAGYLWLRAYDYQIYRFDKKKKTFLAIADILDKAKFNNIVFDKIISTNRGQVWLTTIDQGLFLVKNTNAEYPEIIRYGRGLADGFQLPANSINFFYEDQKSNIWIGTEKGLCYLFADKSGIYKNQHISAVNLSGQAFTCATEDRKRIWFGTNNGMLIFYEKSAGQFLCKKISDNKLNALCISKNNKILYSSTVGREIITLITSTLLATTSIMPGADPFLSIYEDRSGQLWIEPENHGVVKYNPFTRSFKYFFQKSDATLNYPIKQYSVFEDSENRVWVSMKGGGFGPYNAALDEVEYFHNDPASVNHQFSNNVTCKYFDSSGILWMSTSTRGIDKIIFQRNDFNAKLLVDHTLNKAENEVRGIYNDHENRLWLASKSGKLYLRQNDGKKLHGFFVNEPAGGLGIVYTILQDRNDVIWLGTKGNGLFRADPVDKEHSKYRLTHYQSNKNDSYSLSSNVIYSLLEDKSGRIWVGTFEHGPNLIVYREGKISFINTNNEFKNYPNETAGKIRHLQQDANGKIWMATTNGLWIADINKANIKDYQFISYHRTPGDKTSLGNNDIQFIFRDSKNRMWISTSGGGLNQAIGHVNKDLKFEVFTTEDGLPSDYILSIVEDNSGNLWLGTENGLSRFNPDKLQFRNYDSYDGLPKSGFAEASVSKLANGNLVFGCITGYLVFNPSTLSYQKINANIVFTNFQINNKDALPGIGESPLKFDINNTSHLDLKYNENIISVDFTVLDYRSNNKQAYAYRLIGFKKDWNNVINQHKATYTNLPPGKYVFDVKSLRADLYETTPLKTLSITIFPPPWRTIWAYLIYCVLVAVLIETVRRMVFAMIRLRNKIAVEQRLTELKLNFFTNISHELRTPLTLIINPIEEVLRNENLSEKGYEYINVARRNTKRMVRFINQLLDFRKVQAGKMTLKIVQTEMVSFIKEISGYFLETADEKHIELLITSNVDELLAWIDPEKIDIVIYNLLSNAFKFSPNGKTIKIVLNYIPGNHSFTIQLIDQGIGVPSDKLNDIFELYYEVDKADNVMPGTGIGLALSKEIVQLHHGNITAHNNAVNGLTVITELMAGKEHFNGNEVVFVNHSQVSKENQEFVKTIPVRPAGHPLVSPNGEAEVVLIVDDNTELRKFLADQLQTYYKVTEAENGKEGWEKAIQLLPDLIVSDVMMPEMDGIELLDKLKNNTSTSHIPVILLTAKSSVESQIEGLSYGADYYITKPFHTDFVLASINNLLKQRKKIFESLLSEKKTIELKPGEIVITSKDESFLKEVITMVENRMEDPELNIDMIAESLLMGRTTFYKKFKSLTNLAPVEFIRDMRLKRGKQLLDAGETNISTIAYNIGFGNGKYFSTCFKEKFHMSPSEYLKVRKP